jgi:hypothetical protein
MPDEYISREAALMKLMQDGCSAKNLQSISEMPAADVAEVVRCKGCIDYIGGMCFRCGLGHEVSVDADDFCSRGVTE